MVEQADPALLDWIRERSADLGAAGYGVSGWDDSIWILHRMYEHVGITDETTWDEARKRQIATGRVEPRIVGTINLDELTSTGAQIGGREPLDVDWRRLSWDELATRLGTSFADVTVPPCGRWFPYKSWPMRIMPPCEGSMEAADLRELVEVLGRHSTAALSTPCLFFFAPLLKGNFDTIDFRAANLSEVLDLYRADEQSPSNFWPEDRSWFVYTDYDLEGTQVSGTRSLIADLIDDSRLETIRRTW